jgi:hypothetical protein
MSLSPGNPTLWAGVMFVRTGTAFWWSNYDFPLNRYADDHHFSGPYAPAILRFEISFPPAYPALPPLVVFSTDIFHPLITPLTTFMYTTDIQDSGTVSATDDERLPPGGFSLRHGFPSWFGRASKSAVNSRQTSGQYLRTPVKSPGGSVSGRDTPESGPSSGPNKARNHETRQHQVSMYEFLAYIRNTFDDADVLDTVQLEAAGNPGAWHAWRTHRLKSGKIIPPPQPVKDESMQWHDGLSDDEDSPSTPDGYQRLPGGTPLLATTRRPGEWNWDGVWEHRVKRGVGRSLAESVLYGNIVSNDDLVSRDGFWLRLISPDKYLQIRFLSLDDDQVQTIKENMIRSLDAA